MHKLGSLVVNLHIRKVCCPNSVLCYYPHSANSRSRKLSVGGGSNDGGRF